LQFAEAHPAYDTVKDSDFICRIIIFIDRSSEVAGRREHGGSRIAEIGKDSDLMANY
jgi:hypothetical protein